MIEGHHILAILKRVEFTGFTIHPYIYRQEDLPYLLPIERITGLNIDSFDELPETVIRLFRLSEEIEPHAIVTRFTKKKLSLKEFFNEKNRLISEIVRPFTDRKLFEITELLAQASIPLYDASAMPHLYPTDEIKIVHERAKTVLRFDRDAEGTVYTLEVFSDNHKIQLQDQDNFLLSNDPCILVSNRKLIMFEKNITGKILSPFFQKQNIEIPKRLENKYFSSFIKKLVNNSDIIANGFSIQDVIVEPKAILSMEKDWQGISCLILKFNYGEKSFLPENLQKNFTELKTNEEGFTFYRSKRNKSWETQKINFLKKQGLIQHVSCFKLTDNKDNDNLFGLINWLIDHKEELTINGFGIDDETESRYVLTASEIKQSLETDHDWFDLKITLRIENHEIPFISLRHHILNKQREFKLPDGKIFIIPIAWFERYKDVMIHAESSGKDIRLHKFHYQLLDKLNIKKTEDFEPQTALKVITLPSLNNVKLRAYQVTGFEWMVRLKEMGFGGILADDMGLGKTLQAISLLAEFYSLQIPEAGVPEHKQIPVFSHQLSLFEPVTDLQPVQVSISRGVAFQNRAASIIVMPASLIHNWANELSRFAPFLRKLVYTGTGRKKSLNFFKNYEIILTTYGTLRNDIDFLSSYSFEYAILDEGQYIKNPGSQTAQSVFRIHAQNKFILTGTPVENSLSDLWSQMNFTNPELLGDLSKFNTYYAAPLAKDPESSQSESLLSMIRPFILRRTKDSVAPELPELTETVNYCEMTEEQRTLYESEKSKIRNQVFEQIEKGNMGETPIMVLKALMQLRQIANHPRMTHPESEVNSGKFEQVTDKLETIIAENHRVLIFSSFVRHLNLIEEFCQIKNLKYSKLTGATTNRGKVISGFKENKDVNIFLISLKAGGTGLNLTEADYVFVLDPWWNPAAEMQAVNRAHRIGQNKSVFVYKFITKDSIEEKIMKLQEKKKALADAFIKPQSAISGMSKEEIMKLFD
ncbi:MAG TPA: DEAD/DEAH box helicase [Lentimicrobium sp.]|nr:DEAD/DEAH box helicase [Lentimicrobium sp.]